MATTIRSMTKNVMTYADMGVGIDLDLSVLDTDYRNPTKISKVIGSNFDDFIHGNNTPDQQLLGGLGDDTLMSDGLFVTFNGGDGNDTVNFSNQKTMVYADLAAGTTMANDKLVSIENLIGGSGNNALYGSSGANRLIGGRDGDLLDGRGGADTMIGGQGSDTYYVDNLGDVVVELDGQGTDRVVSALQSYTLDVNFEDLQLIGDAVSGTGNAVANLMLGSDKSNILFGMDGNDILRGNGGNDVLDGGTGNDILAGGAGQDTLTGGAGKDKFQFLAVSESSADAFDHITDFAKGDLIDLSKIDANSNTAKNDTFKLIGDDAFSSVAGQLRFEKHDGYTLVQGDTNGDGIADFAISLDGYLAAMKTSDFIL